MGVRGKRKENLVHIVVPYVTLVTCKLLHYTKIMVNLLKDCTAEVYSL